MSMADKRNDRTYRAISGRSPRDEQASWVDGLLMVVRRADGNVSQAARDLDVPRRTLRRWLDPNDKSVPPPERRAQVARAARRGIRRDRLKPGRERRIRAAQTVTVECRYRYDEYDTEEDHREVTFTIGDGGHTDLADDVMDALVDAYLAGASGTDPDYDGGLFHVIASAMTDDWYREHMMTSDPEEGFDIVGVTIK